MCEYADRSTSLERHVSVDCAHDTTLFAVKYSTNRVLCMFSGMDAHILTVLYGHNNGNYILKCVDVDLFLLHSAIRALTVRG